MIVKIDNQQYELILKAIYNTVGSEKMSSSDNDRLMRLEEYLITSNMTQEDKLKSEITDINKVHGEHLTDVSRRVYGLERRFYGLEPDFMLRKRFLKTTIKGRV